MEMKKKRRVGDKGELIFYISIIALPLLQVLIFYFYVNFNSILMAFQKYTLTKGFYFDKNDLFANFSKFWFELTKSRNIIIALKNSLLVWFFTAIVGTFLSIVFSYYIFKKWFLAKMFKFFLFLPSVLPSILLVLVFRTFMDSVIPEIAKNKFDIVMSPIFQNANLRMPAVIFYTVFIGFGTQMLIYTGAMGQISPDVLEAGKVDGVTTTREFFSIVVPMILPTVATFMIANVATIFTNQANLYSFFAHKANVENKTIGYYLYELIQDTEEYPKRSMYNYASAFGIICTFVAFPLTLLARKLLTRGEEA